MIILFMSVHLAPGTIALHRFFSTHVIIISSLILKPRGFLIAPRLLIRT